MKINEKTIGIIGMKRSGKSYLTRALVEGLKKECIVWDTIGALQPKNCQKYTVEINKIPEQAAAWGVLMKEVKNTSISIDLNNLTREEKVEFADISLKIGGGMKNKFVVFDEISDFLPQKYSQSQEVERLIRHSGNAGNTFIFNTQRPAYLNKNTFNLIDVLYSFKLVYPKDIEVLKEILSDTGKDDLTGMIHTIKGLRVGEFGLFIFADES